MATFIILNATKNPAYKPGDIVDDNTVDIRTVQTAGGALVAAGDPVLDQVAAELQKRVVSLEAGAAIMLAAYTEFVQRGLAATDLDVAQAQADITLGGVIPATASTPAAAAAMAALIGPRFGSVTLAPLGADDSTRAETVYAACATAGYPVCNAKGTWQAATECAIPSRLDLSFAPNSTMAGSMESGGLGASTNSIFRAYPILDPEDAAGPRTVLTAALPTVVGSNVIYVDAFPAGAHDYAAGTTYAPGDVAISGVAYECIAATAGNAPPNATYWKLASVVIAVSYLWQTYDVIGADLISAGKWRLTLDEATMRAFPAGTVVAAVAGFPKDIKINFNGLRVSSTSGDDLHRLWFARGCETSGARIVRPNGFDGLLIAFDSGGRDNYAHDHDIELGADVCGGFEAVENVRPRFVHCRSRGAAAVCGFLSQANQEPYFEDCHHDGPVLHGFYFRPGVNDALHYNLNPRMINCSTARSAGHGIDVSYTSGMRGEGVASTNAGVGFVDLDMQRAGVTDWLQTNAVCTKQTATPPGTLPRYMRIAPDGTGGGMGLARIAGLTIGRKYRVECWVRGDGADEPCILLGNTVVAGTGTHDNTWQWIDVTDTQSASSYFRIGTLFDIGYVEFGPIRITDVTDVQPPVPAGCTGGSGLHVSGACSDVHYSTLDTARNSGYGALVEDTSTLRLGRWISTDECAGGLCVNGSGTVKIDNATINNTRKGTYGIITAPAWSGLLRIGDVDMTLNTDGAQGSTALDIRGTGTVIIGDLTINTTLCGFVLVGANAKVRITGYVRVLTCANLLTLAAGATQAQINLGWGTSNGAGALSIAFTQVSASSLIRLYDMTTGLIVESAATITPGTKVDWAGLTINHVYYAQVL